MGKEKCKYCGSTELTIGTFRGLFCKKCNRVQIKISSQEAKINKEVIRHFFK